MALSRFSDCLEYVHQTPLSQLLEDRCPDTNTFLLVTINPKLSNINL